MEEQPTQIITQLTDLNQVQWSEGYSHVTYYSRPITCYSRPTQTYILYTGVSLPMLMIRTNHIFNAHLNMDEQNVFIWCDITNCWF